MRTLLSCLLLCMTGPLWAAGGMTELTYMDQDQTGGGYVTRYLVTDRFLRLDFGRDREDFVLFDRQTRRTYNISHEQKNILIFEAGEIAVPQPKEWKIKEDMLEDRAAQKHFDLIVNGTVCARIVASERFLPDVAKALLEFHEVMAATHAGTYLATPADQRDDCDLARLVLAPQRWFKYGMPFDELRSNGFSRRLLSYEADVRIRPKAFEIPEDYRQIKFNDVQGAAP